MNDSSCAYDQKAGIQKKYHCSHRLDPAPSASGDQVPLDSPTMPWLQYLGPWCFRSGCCTAPTRRGQAPYSRGSLWVSAPVFLPTLEHMNKQVRTSVQRWSRWVPSAKGSRYSIFERPEGGKRLHRSVQPCPDLPSGIRGRPLPFVSWPPRRGADSVSIGGFDVGGFSETFRTSFPLVDHGASRFVAGR